MIGGKLGKLPARFDAKAFLFAEYVDTSKLPPVAAHVDWMHAVPPGGWPMLANDRLGDCTAAAACHAIHGMTASAQRTPVVLADADALRMYEDVSGYRPGDEASDVGANEADCLRYWRTVGVGGHKLGAYAAIRPRNHDHVKLAIQMMGALYVGVELPKSIERMHEWAVPKQGPVANTPWGDARVGSLGGHAIACMKFDEVGVTCVTWGAPVRMTWNFWDVFVSESYALISPDFLNDAGVAPSGFNAAQLAEDLRAL